MAYEVCGQWGFGTVYTEYTNTESSRQTLEFVWFLTDRFGNRTRYEETFAIDAGQTAQLSTNVPNWTEAELRVVKKTANPDGTTTTKVLQKEIHPSFYCPVGPR